MNAPNETSPARSGALPDAWISRVFAVMSAMYGAKFSDLWAGTDMAAVRAMWAEKLAGFASMPEAIKRALDSLDSRPRPPNLPEFLGLCRQEASRLQSMTPRIEGPKLNADEQRERAEKAAAAATKLKSFDWLDWAKHPVSAKAMAAVRDCAQRGDKRFVSILADLKAQGVCDADGKLLKVWIAQDKVFRKAA